MDARFLPNEEPAAAGHFIEFRNVSKAFGDHLVLDDVSFFVDHGETCVIMGRSGVGKSVTLTHILGFLRARWSSGARGRKPLRSRSKSARTFPKRKKKHASRNSRRCWRSRKSRTSCH